MFIKIVAWGERTERMFECASYKLSYFDGRTHIIFDDGKIWMCVEDHRVYVMNNDGKTIDSFDYTLPHAEEGTSISE